MMSIREVRGVGLHIKCYEESHPVEYAYARLRMASQVQSLACSISVTRIGMKTALG